jgi:hypothetical protein
MSQQDNFSGGFLLGAIVGGITGGVLGALLTAQRLTDGTEDAALPEGKKPARPRKRMRGGTPEQNIELARRSLEDKIAQLNDAIDDVRQQLGNVNGRAGETEPERSLRDE